MKTVGKWFIRDGNLNVTVPKIRKVGRTWYPLKVKYLGDKEDPVDMLDSEHDLSKELGKKIKLIRKSHIGGDVVEVD